MTRSDKIRFIILRSIGNFLLLFAIFGVFATFGPAVYYEITYKISQARGITYAVEDDRSRLGELMAQNRAEIDDEQGGFASLLTGPKEQILVPKDTDFSIVIPKIGASSKVIPNVDPNSESDFLPKLQEGVAHAKGTVFPGFPGNIYLFAHSADNFWDVGRYNAVFYLLKDLVPGDEIVIFFEGKRHDYVVTKTEIVDPDNVQALVDNRTGKEQLVLQTCWPPGTTWKRFLVFASPKK